MGKSLIQNQFQGGCKACVVKRNENKNDPLAFKLWRESHECKINYEGSAPSMEPAGALKIFQRSIKNRGLGYIHYYGDGDSKSYSTVKNVYKPH